MLEKEIAKLDGQMTLLEQQRLMIESKLRICAPLPFLTLPDRLSIRSIF